jgi:hypothetical protein
MKTNLSSKLSAQREWLNQGESDLTKWGISYRQFYLIRVRLNIAGASHQLNINFGQLL